ncbi:Uncharacterised protein [Mycobacteroides abscessus subsp. massiliense]|nr:Uncharacterised protein [Mycobacteroides abscessus subsp. massiliense]SKU97167.1 Uncharacterised protein [Mycobacteroides abscessus subsp. massiliense]
MSEKPALPELICDVCGKEPALGVCSVPGVPISMAYGDACLKANAHPWFILVGETATMGGLDGVAEWWIRMVEDTIAHLGGEYTRDRFDREVVEAHAEMKALGLV